MEESEGNQLGVHGHEVVYILPGAMKKVWLRRLATLESAVDCDWLGQGSEAGGDRLSAFMSSYICNHPSSSS
jgi:hypothetical protein